MMELEKTEEKLNDLIKDDSGKIIFTYLLCCLFIPKDELEKILIYKEQD